MLLNIVKTLGLLLSFAGWMAGLKRLLNVDRCFLPAAAVSWITVLVYFGGIFSLLLPAAGAAYAVGLVLAVWELIRLWGRGWPRTDIRLWELCFGLGSVLFLAILPGARLEHYDNYSHWGIVVKLMLSTNAFPTSQTGLIDFQNYPLGTSSFLYYVCRFAGHSQGMMLLAQGVMIFAFFYAVFGVIRHTKSFLLYGVLGAGMSLLSLFNITIRINNLLVDFLLPVIALACWAAIRRYADQPEKLPGLLVPYQALLLIVKSTGAIYVAFVVCAWLLQVPKAVRQLPGAKHSLLAPKHARTRQPRHSRPAVRWGAVFLPAAAGLALSFSTWAAWQWHMKTAFPNAVNKFDTNLVEVGAAGTGKTPEQLREILNLFLRTSVDLSTRPALGFVLMNLLALGCGIWFWFLWKRSQKKLAAQVLLLDGMVVLYYIGILLLYLFSMPADEALVLAGFDRYACSIIVLFAGGVVMQLTAQVEDALQYAPSGRVQFGEFQEKNRYQKGVLLCLALVFGLLTSEYNGTLYTQRQDKNDLTRIMQSVVGDRWPADGKEDTTRYLLYGSDYDGRMTSYYFQYVARYYLYAPNVDAICSFYEGNLENLLSQYECLVVIEPDRAEQRMLQKHFGVDGSAGFYRIEKNGKTLRLVPEAQNESK